MAISNLVAFFIVLTTAATLHARGVINISTSAQAAKALEPLAGRWAFLFFVCGIMGTGLLAVPVLAGSTAYAIGEAAHWRASLHTPATAPKFYVAITAATLIGLSLNFMQMSLAGHYVPLSTQLDRVHKLGKVFPIASEGAHRAHRGLRLPKKPTTELNCPC